MIEYQVGNIVHPLQNRQNFADLINFKKYQYGAEIGVRYGWFSKWLLDHSNINMYCIDPWTFNKENHQPDDSWKIANANLKPYKNRAIILKKTSKDAAPIIKEKLGFIYIDALHDYDSVSEDISIWWPKLANGGCIAGHDYCEKEWPGIVKAVKEFVDRENLTLYLTGVGDSYGETDYNKKSWYVFKG